MCLSGCLTAYRRHVLIELEPILENRNVLGVPIKYGEDRFLTRQIVKAGYRTRHDDGRDLLHEGADDAARATSTSSCAGSARTSSTSSSGIGHAWQLHPLLACTTCRCSLLLLVYPFVIVTHVVARRVLRARDVPRRADRRCSGSSITSRRRVRAAAAVAARASDLVPADGGADAGRVPAAHAARPVHARLARAGRRAATRRAPHRTPGAAR